MCKPVVFVVDDDPALRQSLELLLISAGHNVRSFASAQEFLDAYDDDPGCMITDIRMPGMSGLELQERMAVSEAIIPIVVLTGHGDVPAAVRAMKVGAIDFIEKPFNAQHLLDVVERALAEDAERRAHAAETADITERLQTLTPREREVMEHVVRGAANKVVAAELGISERTVELHRSRLMKKMHARSLPELVRMVTAGD